MKKKLLLVLMLIAAVVVMPRVSAAEGIKLGEVKDITNVDTLKSTTHKSFTHDEDYRTVTIAYEEATFRLLDAGSADTNSEGRQAGYAWIGLKVAPATNAKKYAVTFNGGTPDEEKEVNGDIEDFIGFNAEELEEAAKTGKNLEFTYDIEWKNEDGSESVKQSIVIIIMPQGITLQAQDYETAAEGKKEVWNFAKYEEVRPREVTVKVIKDGEEVVLEEPISYVLIDTKKLTDDNVAVMKAILSDENLELIGLYTDAEYKNEFDVTKDITEDTTIYVVYKTKSAEAEEETDSEEENPETLDNATMYVALASASLLVANSVAVYYKRFN